MIPMAQATYLAMRRQEMRARGTLTVDTSDLQIL